MLVTLPSSRSLSYWFNWGSFLGIALVFQVISGLLLVLNYTSMESYSSVVYIIMETHYGWFLKLFHSNNASVVFLAVYMHLYKGLSMSSYRLSGVWYTGLVMFVLIIGAGFTGYVLVGSQISIWAAMVITSLIGVIPVVGSTLMYFVWGGYSITWLTLQFLFVVHFVLPFMVLGIMVVHLTLLHRSGSTSVAFSHSGVMKVPFFPFYWVKDIVNLVLYQALLTLILLYPYSIGEVELFESANLLSSPAHIVPEWYFLTSYAILRSVPSKGLGVLIILASVGILFLYPSSIGYVTPITSLSSPIVVYLVGLQLILSYLGFSPISQPYVYLALISTTLYFISHILVMVLNIVTSMCFEVEEMESPF